MELDYNDIGVFVYADDNEIIDEIIMEEIINEERFADMSEEEVRKYAEDNFDELCDKYWEKIGERFLPEAERKAREKRWESR